MVFRFLARFGRELFSSENRASSRRLCGGVEDEDPPSLRFGAASPPSQRLPSSSDFDGTSRRGERGGSVVCGIFAGIESEDEDEDEDDGRLMARISG